MPIPDPEEKAKIIIEAVKQANLRAVISKGWGYLAPKNMDQMPGNVFIIDTAPHEHLFPLMKAVVHHGGAGTTAAGLRAGKPTAISPFIADQPFWGRLMKKRGFGPQMLPNSKWTVDSFAAMLTDLVENQSYAEKAEAIAAEIAQEDGIASAVELVKRYVGAPQEV